MGQPTAFFRSPWLKRGFWNTLEHLLTRLGDAAMTLVLLWVLSPELFARLALAQAYVAPVLLLFIAPETVIYRDYAPWREEGREAFHFRIRVFRYFGWAKLPVGLILAAAMAKLFTARTDFYSLSWAFALALGPQVFGTDREFLRLDLRLKSLNLLSTVYKTLLLTGTILIAWNKPQDSHGLCVVVLVATALSAWLAFYLSTQAIQQMPQTDRMTLPSPPLRVLWTAISHFSFWNHLSGIVFNWVQTMDLFFLGFWRIPARTVGLYAAVLKVCNFANALPLSLGNLFSIWIGRNSADQEKTEQQIFLKNAGLISIFNGIQIGVLLLASHWILGLVSHSSLSEQELRLMRIWMSWILGGLLFFTPAFFLSGWVNLRRPIRINFLKAYLPWIAFSILAYGFAGARWQAIGVAMVNIPVNLVFLGLIALRLKSRSDSIY